MIKISLIVIVYNLENYIQSCIQSILLQLKDDTELIVVNDGSTDESEKSVMELIKHHSNAKIYTKKNGGPGSARNYGMTKATGQYIWFIDGDDEIGDDAISTFEENFRHFKYSDLISFSLAHRRLGEHNFRVENKLIQLTNVDVYSFLSKIEILPSSVCCFFFKRSFLRDNNLLFETEIFYEDNEFMLRVYNKVEKISSINKWLYIYKARLGSTMKSEKTEKKINSVFQIIDTCVNMKAERLKGVTIENQLYWFIKMYLNLIKDTEHYKFSKSRLRKKVKRQNLFRSDSKGILLNKISYNLFKVYII